MSVFLLLFLASIPVILNLVLYSTRNKKVDAIEFLFIGFFAIDFTLFYHNFHDGFSYNLLKISVDEFIKFEYNEYSGFLVVSAIVFWIIMTLNIIQQKIPENYNFLNFIITISTIIAFAGNLETLFLGYFCLIFLNLVKDLSEITEYSTQNLKKPALTCVTQIILIISLVSLKKNPEISLIAFLVSINLFLLTRIVLSENNEKFAFISSFFAIFCIIIVSFGNVYYSRIIDIFNKITQNFFYLGMLTLEPIAILYIIFIRKKIRNMYILFVISVITVVNYSIITINKFDIFMMLMMILFLLTYLSEKGIYLAKYLKLFTSKNFKIILKAFVMFLPIIWVLFYIEKIVNLYLFLPLLLHSLLTIYSIYLILHEKNNIGN